MRVALQSVMWVMLELLVSQKKLEDGSYSLCKSPWDAAVPYRAAYSQDIGTSAMAWPSKT